jgi:hypothetical protein|tara:strand:- start:3022 stop:3159 length:138 start_codon:yes stop_codon:yes gene_type:complete
MLSSYEWMLLRVLETELQNLELNNNKPKIRNWLQQRINNLKNKIK